MLPQRLQSGALIPSIRALSVLVLAGLIPLASAAAPPAMRARMGEALDHLIGESPVAVMPWVDVTKHQPPGGWWLRISVDEQGVVTRVRLLSGNPAERPQAIRLARGMRFRPFLREGRAVPAVFKTHIRGDVQDYVGPTDRAFPASSAAEAFNVALLRTPCFGSCPWYRVTLRSDGWVAYHGMLNVAVEGAHRWRIGPEAVAALLTRFRQADFFRLKGYYVLQVSDNPSYVTRLTVGPRRKFVWDYAGAHAEHEAAEARPSGEAPFMPPEVTQLEDAIDDATGVKRWVEGEGLTVAAWRQAGWNIHSKAAGRTLAVLAGRCQVEPAAEFVRAGVPVNVRGQGSFAMPPIVAAVRCGDLALVRGMAARGALARHRDAQAFLEHAAAYGVPAFVALAQAHGANLASAGVGPEGSLLHIAVRASPSADPDVPGRHDAGFDPARVVEMLIAAGAKPNVRDREGNTALHVAGSGAAVRALVRGGADIHARDAAGGTPLDAAVDEDVALALLEAGALPLDDAPKLTALLARAQASSWPRLVEALTGRPGSRTVP